jgi:hypothetical protein
MRSRVSATHDGGAQSAAARSRSEVEGGPRATEPGSGAEPQLKCS